jgi:hypothetical protein
MTGMKMRALSLNSPTVLAPPIPQWVPSAARGGAPFIATRIFMMCGWR